MFTVLVLELGFHVKQIYHIGSKLIDAVWVWHTEPRSTV